MRLQEAVRVNQDSLGNLPILLPKPAVASGDDYLHPHPGFVLPLRQLADIQ